MRARLVSAALIPVALVITACGEEEESTAVITIETSDWNGWDRDHESTVTTEKYTVAEGDIFEIDVAYGGPMTAEVDSIEEDTVVFTIDEAMAPRKETGINLRDTITQITVTEDQITMLATPTTDEGILLDITVEITP